MGKLFVALMPEPGHRMLHDLYDFGVFIRPSAHDQPDGQHMSAGKASRWMETCCLVVYGIQVVAPTRATVHQAMLP